LMNRKALVFNTRLFPVGHFDRKTRHAIYNKYLKYSGRPTYIEGHWKPPFPTENLTFLRHVDLQSGNRRQTRFLYTQAGHEFMDWLLRQPVPREPSARMLRQTLLAKSAKFLGHAKPHYDEMAMGSWHASAVAATEEAFYANLLRAQSLLADNTPAAAASALEVLQVAQRQRDQAQVKADRALVFVLMGDASSILGRPHEATAHFRTALTIWPHPKAEARKRLARKPSKFSGK
jgi:hypothetical protein